MQRRVVLSSVLALGGAGLAPWAGAAVGFTSSEGTQALRVALEKGAQAAVSELGRVDGFLGNDKVRIPLPSVLDNAAPLLKTLGRGRQLEELQTTMNRAAEQAVPLALPLLKSAIRSMSVSDAQQILAGGDTSVTAFFAGKTREPLSVQFLPIVSRATERLSLTRRYNELAGKAAGMGLLKGDQANVQQYVTGKALDGLFLMIGEQEKKIRQDPVGTGSAILKKVFGSL
jgi:hypothetical protein